MIPGCSAAIIGYRDGTRRATSRPSNTIIRASGGSLRLSYYEINWGPNDMPLFPGERRGLCKLVFKVPKELIRRGFSVLLWRSRPARGQSQVGTVIFRHEANDEWSFKPLTIGELEEMNNWSIDFAP